MRKAGCLSVLLIALIGLGCPTTPRLPSRVTPLIGTNDAVAEVSVTKPMEAATNIALNFPATAERVLEISNTVAVSGSSPSWISWQHWAETNSLASPRMTRRGPGLDYSLETKTGVLLLKMGTRQALWNGLNLGLGFVPFVRHGEPFIHSLDAAKNFEPLLSLEPVSLKGDSVIVIDPGHGGVKPGAKSALVTSYEKEFTLDWAQRIERILRSAGHKVLLTRTNDVNPSLSERVAFADQVHAACFISLHFNSMESEMGVNQGEGVETYCVTPVGMPSNLTREFKDDISSTFPNNAFDAQNLQLAIRVHRALIERTGGKDRGVRRARFMTVVREQHCPAILIEGGYLSNPREAKLIADANYRQKLAEAVAQAIQP